MKRLNYYQVHKNKKPKKKKRVKPNLIALKLAILTASSSVQLAINNSQKSDIISKLGGTINICFNHAIAVKNIVKETGRYS